MEAPVEAELEAPVEAGNDKAGPEPSGGTLLNGPARSSVGDGPHSSGQRAGRFCRGIGRRGIGRRAIGSRGPAPGAAESGDA